MAQGIGFHTFRQPVRINSVKVITPPELSPLVNVVARPDMVSQASCVVGIWEGVNKRRRVVILNKFSLSTKFCQEEMTTNGFITLRGFQIRLTQRMLPHFGRGC